MSLVNNSITTSNTSTCGIIGVGTGTINAKINNAVLSTSIGNVASEITYPQPSLIQKSPNLIFKLFNAENGHILEVTDKVHDPAQMYSGMRFDNNSKVYILSSSENLGEKIAQILSVYTLQK